MKNIKNKIMRIINTNKKETIVSIVALLFIIVAVVGVTYAAFTYTGLGTKSNKVTTSTITMNYNEATNGITLTDAFPISDNDGKQLTGEGRTFSFTVTVTTGNNTAVGYEVSAVKDNTSTLGNNDVRIYLEKSTTGAEGTYSSVLEPTGFSGVNATTEIGTPAGEMLLHSDSTTSTRTDYYILRMWVAEDYIVTGESKFFTIKVNVYGTDSHINVSSISLNKNSMTLEEGESEQLSASILPDYATDKSVTWESSNTDIAVVDSNGNVTAQSITGITATATITATDSKGHSASCVVTVNKPEPTGVEVVGSPEEINLITGGSTTLEANTVPVNANSNEVEWTTSDSSVVDIERYTEANASGTGSSKSITANKITVTAVGPGTATITAKSASNPSAELVSISVEILDPEVEGITLDKDSITIDRGQTTTIVGTITPSNSRDKKVRWSTSNSSVATVSCTGGSTNSSGEIETTSTTSTCTVNAIGNGTATITVTDAKGHSDTASVTVQSSVASNLSMPVSTTVGRTATNNFSITGTTSDNQSDPRDLDVNTMTIEQTSNIGTLSCENILTNNVVTSVYCEITGTTTGSTTITATTTGGATTSMQLTVDPIVPSSVSITDKPTNNKLVEGDTHALSASVSPANSDNTSVTWTSSNTSVATVTSGGVINAVSAGTTTITVTTASGSRTDDFTLMVKSPRASDFELGDYVNLTPSYSGSYSCTTTGCSGSITPSELNMWRVIAKNANGTVDIVSEYTSSTYITFSGDNGYKYYVTALNDLASKYVNTAYTSGYRHFGYNGQTGTINGSLNTSNAGTSSTPDLSDSIGAEYRTGYQGDTLYAKDYNAVNSALGTLEAQQVSDNYSGHYYCLASRYYEYVSRATSQQYGWYARNIQYGYIYTRDFRYIDTYKNKNYESNVGCNIRPILTLRDNIIATSGDGSSSNSAWSFE